jgi:electron transfer flavoprotein alpha subunit
MSAPAGRRVVVLLPGDEEDAAGPALLDAAAMLALRHGGALDVLALRVPGRPPAAVQALPGAASWWEIEHERLGGSATHLLVEVAVQALASTDLAAAGPILVLLPPGPEGVELASRLASRLDGVSLGGCSELRLENGAVTGQRAGYGGRVMMALRTHQARCFATWRAGAVASPDPRQAPQVRRLVLDGELPAAIDITPVAQADSSPPLEGARVVVSGGRGMQGDEGFGWLRRIAAALGGALGGSLPTIDAGWLPVARQIGQSGKFVAPKVYLAVGISGTPQHLAGISNDSTVFAINKDPEAAIFNVSEAGIVGDWREVLPALAERLENVQRRQP